MKRRTKNQFTANQHTQTPRNFYSANTEHRKLSTSQLESSQAYQRPVDAKHVKDIVNNFDPLFLDEIIVSYRDNKYYVVDGQNRIAAFKFMNGGRDCIVNCKVFHELTYEQEATMFYHLDSIKKKLRYSDKVRAKAEAKSDPTIIAINDILSKYNLKWSYNSGGCHSDGIIRASMALVSCYEELGPHMFELAIRLLVRTWKGQHDSLSAAFINGMCLFVRTYVHIADEEKFVKRLSTVTPTEIKSLARAEMSAANNELKYAKAILNRYNFRAGRAKLENLLD